MPYLKRFAFILLVGALLMPVLSCGSRHDSDEKYVLISANIQVPYWQMAKAGFFQAARDLQVRSEFAGPDTYDPKGQAEEFRKAVAQKPTGLLISAADVALMKPEVDAAIAAGIPVITIDSDVPDSKRLFFIGTNNYQAGVMGGRRMEQELHGKGNVVAFTMPSQTNLQERLRGYQDAFAGTQVKISRVVDIKGDPRVVFDTTTQIVAKEKDKVDGFVCLEAQGGKEVATVLSNSNISGKIVMAMDTDPDTLEWVRKGVIAATISQKPYTMGYFGLKVLDDLHHHKLKSLDADWAKDSIAPIPSFVDTGSSLVDKSNLDAFQQAQQSVTNGK
jgi:ribose transport system substrate-binding protein